MNKTVGQSSALKESSDLVVPAVRGEFYKYSSTFTEGRPLYVFMKCKSNKDRMLASAAELGSECNLVFLLGDRQHVCSIRTAHASGLLGDSVSGESFGETWIAVAGISPEDFYKLRSEKNVEALTSICHEACAKRETSMALEPGLVVAMMTDVGKYGMFLVKELAPAGIEIDACHILL